MKKLIASILVLSSVVGATTALAASSNHQINTEGKLEAAAGDLNHRAIRAKIQNLLRIQESVADRTDTNGVNSIIGQSVDVLGKMLNEAEAENDELGALLVEKELDQVTAQVKELLAE